MCGCIICEGTVLTLWMVCLEYTNTWRCKQGKHSAKYPRLSFALLTKNFILSKHTSVSYVFLLAFDGSASVPHAHSSAAYMHCCLSEAERVCQRSTEIHSLLHSIWPAFLFFLRMFNYRFVYFTWRLHSMNIYRDIPYATFNMEIAILSLCRHGLLHTLMYLPITRACVISRYYLIRPPASSTPHTTTW